MFRRVRVLLAALVLVGGSLAFRASTPSATEAWHQIPGCPGLGTSPNWIGDYHDPQGFNAAGNEALINISGTSQGTSYFGPCTWGSEVDDVGLAAAFIQIVPGAGNLHYGEWDMHFTLGVVRCAYNTYWPYHDICGTDPGAIPIPRLFAEVGSCNGFATRWHFGSAGYDGHVFRLEKRTNPNRFVAMIDGVDKLAINYTDSLVDCWMDSYKRASAMGQVIDEGDVVGSYANPTSFDLMKVKTSTWNTWTPNCGIHNSSPSHPFVCAGDGAGWMDIRNTWTN